MKKISDLFDVHYGHSLELNALKQSKCGINFVSRTAANNGVAAKVANIPGVAPMPGGLLTVALGGSVLETFVQPEPFYCGYHIFCLSPKKEMSLQEKLFYCCCIRANKYRYNYGRQANRTLKDILVPDHTDIPDWTDKVNPDQFNGTNKPLINTLPKNLSDVAWKLFHIGELFEIKKGKRLTKLAQTKGKTPFIGSIDNNNGVSQHIGQKPIHQGNTITVNYNGSVAKAFFQPAPFWASDDVNVLYPKGFKLTPQLAMFIISIIEQEKYRFNYGRKWHLDRMRESEIYLPVKKDKTPDFEFMGSYIEHLSFSSQLQ